jgi:cytoskeleton protein RodZ
MPDASHDFGAHLRQAREQRGVSLHDIATRTKISVLVLEALERNDVSRLPGGIFTRAFVRAYAQEVGLEPEEAVRRFLARFPDESTEEGPKHYDPNPERIEVDEPPTFGRAWHAVAWSVPLLLVVAYFGFGGRLPWWRDRAAQPSARASQPTTPPPPAAIAPPPPVAEPPVAQTAAPPVSAPAEPPAPAGGQQASSAPPGQTPSAAAAVAAAAPGPVPSGGFRLTLAPREACWVSVRSSGVSLFSGLMQAGERKDLTIEGEVTLTVGNAGAFDYFIDQQPGRSLGGPGQVATARLSAANVRTFLEAR